MTRPRTAQSLAAEAAFRVRLEELGATLVEPEWLGSKAKHRAICAAGHPCTPTPHYVRAGDGICMTCGGHDPAAAEAGFRARLTELGAELLEPRYLGARVKHRITCAAGHEVFQMPNRLQQGTGLCRKCSGTDPGVAEERFRARVEALGGRVLYDKWNGTDQPHYVECREGHPCYPRPGSVNFGQGICLTCSGRDPVSAEASYRALVISLGGMPLWGQWKGNKSPTLVRCPEGHEVDPRPNDVEQGSGLCRTCGRQDPVASEAKFRARLAALGATPLFIAWTGRKARYEVRCASGHLCRPWANTVMNGQGVCRICRGKEWDVLYVVASTSVVKFGITSGDPAPRLQRHARDGMTEVVRLRTGLPGTAAPDAERAIKAALAMAGERPVRGNEYFDISCLALVLDVADSWLAESVITPRLAA